MVFQNLAKIEMMRKKNQLFGRHFENGTAFSKFFCRIVIFYVPYIYGAIFIAQFRWERWFSQGGSTLGHQWE